VQNEPNPKNEHSKANQPPMNADERRSNKLKELSAFICVNLRPNMVFPAMSASA
jgi:hypothetical protein